MKILLTGSSGYIGKRLLPILVDNGHAVICCVRDVKRFSPPESLKSKIEIIQIDLLDKDSLESIPKDIDGAFYLVHSMSSSSNYHQQEQESAENFRNAISKTNVHHVVYLSGIVNESTLSKHLASRKNVESELSKGSYNFTTLRAGIIIGSGSASFEIMRDLVEKLPVMVTPKWLNTRCQPIGISDVINILSKTIFNPKTFNKNFDIGGPDILTYKDMLLKFARMRNLKRYIITVPVMTPKLSSYWLYFVTSTSYKLAIALVNSMKIEVICRNDEINKILEIEPMSYHASLERAFSKIESNEVVSSWKDAFISSSFNLNLSEFIQVPTYGCYRDIKEKVFADRDDCINKIWSIGGENGWYYANWLWRIRGFMDKMLGGVGLRRGRTSANYLNVGDALDFWRVLYVNKSEGRLLLFAEMKLPGDAWLEFRIVENKLIQTATFRPWGLIGRLYWFSMLPFHGFIFRGMIQEITKHNESINQQKNMKLRIIALGLFMILSCSLFAQEKRDMKSSIGFTFSAIGSSDVINSAGKTLMGAESYSGKSFYTLGVSYIHAVCSWIDIESGIEYSNHTITVNPMYLPNIENPSYNKDVSLLNIPITARVNFLKYFFINGGFMLDLDMGNSSPIESQTGFGALYGIGAKYNLNNGLGAFVNGYYKSHSLVPFSADSDEYRWRLIEGGLRIGITYNF